VFLVQAPDDDLEAIVDSTLGENVEAFFMGARVVFTTREEDNAFRSDSRLPNMCRKPMVSVTHDLGDLPIKVLVYRQRR
jgi:hypothetical protein